MTFEQHCQESLKLFGDRYEYVHRWLDEFMGSQQYGMRHRRIRHHKAGIRQAVLLFGPDAGQVARRHIMSDLMEEGWREDEHPFPEDEDHYVRMGLF
ncbi:MAG: hypothetical protein QMD09_10095 [Desulfatibacillaceae bacterium]|nr:hypothetical protein [Desulfatibacillaceae bacterium]